MVLTDAQKSDSNLPVKGGSRQQGSFCCANLNGGHTAAISNGDARARCWAPKWAPERVPEWVCPPPMEEELMARLLHVHPRPGHLPHPRGHTQPSAGHRPRVTVRLCTYVCARQHCAPSVRPADRDCSARASRKTVMDLSHLTSTRGPQPLSSSAKSSAVRPGRRRDCHSAASPSTFSRRFNTAIRMKGGLSVK